MTNAALFEDFEWLKQTDEGDLAKDIPRLLAILKRIESVPFSASNQAPRNLALRRAWQVLEYLVIAHDID